MASKSNRSRGKSKSKSPEKPEKPYADFPLYAHATKRWAKRILGKINYFGPWDDPGKALEQFNHDWPYLKDGRTPPPINAGDELTVSDLCNEFLDAKEKLLDSGELSPRSFRDNVEICKRIGREFGRNRLVDDLRSYDFENLRAAFASTHGPLRLTKDITVTKMVFKYGYESGLIDNPVRYGPSFRPPSKKVIRQNRNKNGLRMFEAAELQKIIDTASQPLKAMVLLAANCGFGNSDVANLPQSALNLKHGWVNYPRPKTGIERRCCLWTETVKALRAAIKMRPDPKDPENDALVFITRFGEKWVRLRKQGATVDSVRLEFDKILNKLNLKRKGVGFYAIRHSFQTVAETCRDFPAIRHVMGHTDDSMSSLYRERISDERLKAVTETVRKWLWPKRKRGKRFKA